MSWIDKFEEQMKTPAIGTAEWFVCIDPLQREAARQLVDSRTPVVLRRQADSNPSTFLIMFDDTEFIAGVFDDKVAAGDFAAAWNRCAVAC